MKPDRELLELAAKACGVEKLEFSEDCPLYPFGDRIQHFWNPWNESGDALRLAATLSITVHIHALTISASCLGRVSYLGGWVDRTLDDVADYRHAIVRAAAEIGRTKP